jgi:hypothetical protein
MRQRAAVKRWPAAQIAASVKWENGRAHRNSSPSPRRTPGSRLLLDSGLRRNDETGKWLRAGRSSTRRASAQTTHTLFPQPARADATAGTDPSAARAQQASCLLRPVAVPCFATPPRGPPI